MRCSGYDEESYPVCNDALRIIPITKGDNMLAYDKVAPVFLCCLSQTHAPFMHSKPGTSFQCSSINKSYNTPTMLLFCILGVYERGIKIQNSEFPSN